MSTDTTTDDTTTDGPEVARYGFRTFAIDIDAGRVTPLLAPRVNDRPAVGYNGLSVDPRAWTDGVCVATCAAGHDHDVPDPDCGCGIYATTTLLALHQQYPRHAQTLVAVIAAEDTTIIGTTGMRTEAARVVAYWLNPHTRDADAAVVTAALPNARRFDDCDAMASAYRLRFTPPASETPIPETGLGVLLPLGHGNGAGLGSCLGYGRVNPLFRGFVGPAMAGVAVAVGLTGMARMGAAHDTTTPASAGDQVWRSSADMGTHVSSALSRATSIGGTAIILAIAVLIAVGVRVAAARADDSPAHRAVLLRTYGVALTAPSVFLLFYSTAASPAVRAPLAAAAALLGAAIWGLGAWITYRHNRADAEARVVAAGGAVGAITTRPSLAPGTSASAPETTTTTPDTTGPDAPDSHSGGAATPAA